MIAQLVGMGFHGVAVAMVVLGYRQLKGLATAPLPEDPKGAKFRQLVGATRLMIMASLVFFVGGVGAQVLSATPKPTTVEIHLSPALLPNGVQPPSVMAGTSQVQFDANGFALMTVRPGSSVSVVLDYLLKNLVALRAEADASRHGSQLAAGGFDDDL